ncbi:putative serine esterase-domain-containing protein, partial [Rhodocollybia butyracea]
STSDSVHLLVLLHGMWGNPGHLAEMARIAREERPQLYVFLPETNKEDSTYDGIDWGGERIAQEILQEISTLHSQGKYVRQFSITGYSLGGLVARYVVGILSQRGLFSPDSPDYISPVNFNTIATPHLGVIQYDSFVSTVMHKLGPKLLSRTGEQFFCLDKWGTSQRPLLDVMSDPNLVFYQALSQFKHLQVYANAIHDLTVPYVTAAIEVEDPFPEYETNGLEVSFLDEHYPILTSYSLPSSPPPPPPPKSNFLSRYRDHNSTSDSESQPRAITQKTPRLPLFLQFRFPLNILVYAALPFLFPTVLTLAFVRLSLASRSSKARIKLLEEDVEFSAQSLAQALVHLEKQMDTVADLIDDPSSTLTIPKLSLSAHPILSPLQRTICARLNSLPRLRKERVFIRGVVSNTHSTIVSRDPKVWDKTGVGLRVLRHWAGSLVL